MELTRPLLFYPTQEQDHQTLPDTAGTTSKTTGLLLCGNV